MITCNDNEKILLIARRHRVVLLLETLPIAIAVAAIFILVVAVVATPLSALPVPLVGAIAQFSEKSVRIAALFFLNGALTVCWLTLFLVIVNYWLDALVVTNERVIHVEFKKLFDYAISSIPLDKIQDISADISGVLPAFFHYGDLEVQTAGGFRKFSMRQIPSPEKVKELILEAQENFPGGTPS